MILMWIKFNKSKENMLSVLILYVSLSACAPTCLNASYEIEFE